MGNSALSITGKSDDRAIRDTITQNGHGFLAGDVVRINIDGQLKGIWVKAQADSAENAESVGVVESATTNSFVVIFEGEIDLSAMDFTWFLDSISAVGNNNSVMFLSATSAGNLSAIPPSSPGQIIKPIIVWHGAIGSVPFAQVINYRGTLIGGEDVVDVRNIQPVGTIMPFGGADSKTPSNWVPCNGATYSITAPAYVDLYNVIGYAFGSADGGNSFVVPDMRGRVPLGQGVVEGSPAGASGTGGASSIGYGGGVIDGTDGGAITEYQVPYLITNYIILAKATTNATIVDFTVDDTLKSSGWSGELVGTITNREYTLTDYADHAGVIKKFSVTSRAGGASASLWIGPHGVTALGTAVGYAPGLTAVSVSRTPLVTSATATNSYLIGDRIQLSIAGVTNGQDFQFSVVTLKS